MDLRDRFAIEFAAALTSRLDPASEIAARAYDLAEAMLRERSRRIDADERDAIAMEAPASHLPSVIRLLDVPAEMEELEDREDEDLIEATSDIDPRWLEPEVEPSWDLDPRWREPRPEAAAGPVSPRPGLKRTQPPLAEPEKKTGDRGA